MNYIVLDLEWNQPVAANMVRHNLRGEIIQIGAVKLDENYQRLDDFDALVRPVFYTKMKGHVKRITGIDNQRLKMGEPFPQAAERFFDWCGEDYTLLTWGCDDVSVLKQNMDFFECKAQLPPLCDIQRLFSDVYKCKERKGLKAAMEMLEIEPDEERFFHNALNDAYYTALVFAKMPDPAAVLKYPQQPKQLIHANHPSRAKMKGETFASLAEALASEMAQQPRCPVCGKKTPLEDEYVRQTADKYIGLCKCPHHGQLMIKLRFRPTDDGKRVMNMSVGKATAMNRAYVHTKKLQVQEKEARYLAEHGCLPDPEKELLEADRTSMPFED